jgi:16S rRNA (cytosine967-C5)-methyltransferase
MLLLLGSSRELGLTGPDRAFSHRLHREVVIWRARLDHALSTCSARELDSLDEDVLACLRIGAVQLLVLDIPPHAAVSSTVEVLGNRKRKAFVNAVLRKLVRVGEADDTPLHIRFSHPEELVRRWSRVLLPADLEALLQWNNSVPMLGAYRFDEREPEFSDAPSRILQQEPSRTGRFLPGYFRFRRSELQKVLEAGVFFIQDEAASIAARGAAGLPGRTVLEIGAAPGGKTAHLDGPSDLVVSLDSSAVRMERWLENEQKLGWKSSIPVIASGEQLPFRRRFDKVFIDAPCTNTGVYRRRFGARWNWDETLLSGCIDSQRALLGSACSAVAADGILIYSTCSLEKEENFDQVQWFEETHPQFLRIDFPAPSQLVTDGLLSIFPPEHAIDGLFAAAWKRAP